MRIIGIDPGLQLTGYGCVHLADGQHEPTLIEGGVIRLSPRKALPVRLTELHEELGKVFDELRPELVVVEQLFTHYKHVRTGILMGHARGVILLTAAQRNIDVQSYAATQVKRYLTGRGRADKSQVQRAVQVALGLPTLPDPPDVADALAIALCCAASYDRVRTEATA